MTDEDKGSGTSTTVKILQATSTTLETADHASLGLGAVERAAPGITKAAANIISESVPIIGPAGGATIKTLGAFGGKIAVPLQLVIGTGEVIYDVHKGDYKAAGEDAGGTIGGIAGGIAMGAAIGTMVPIPIVGTVVGGIVGGVIGWWGGKKAGGAIADHFIGKAAAAKAEQASNQAFENRQFDPMSLVGKKTPAVAPVAGATPTPTSSPAADFTRAATPTPTPKPTPTATPTPTVTATSVDTDPVATPTPTATPSGDSLGTLLDRSSSLKGADLKNVFDRVTTFADDSHLSLGTKFSLASMAVSVLKFINIGGWANGLVDWAEHFALDAMKDDLINQGPNLAGSSDTRSHLPGTQNAPTLVPTPALAQ